MKRDPFLYLTTFLCGGSIMAVELAASRFLAPYFGSSAVVWTVLIGIILAAMSFGSLAGGILADRPGARTRLFQIVWVAAIWVALIPVLGRYVISASFFVVMLLFPGHLIVAGAVFSCLTVFAVPCFLLGTVTPGLIKLATQDLETNGRIAGELYALSTVGSIIGTVLPTFLTIPTIGTMRTFWLVALALVLVSMGEFADVGRWRKRTLFVLLLLIASLFYPGRLSYAFWKTGITENESRYNYLQVSEHADELWLSTHVEVGRQSVDCPLILNTGSYWEYGLFGPLFSGDTDRARARRVLILGSAAGTFARQCREYWPNCRIDGVEIDGGIVTLGRERFKMDQARATIHVDDARAFLRRPEAGMYDLILLDAFQDVSIPFHLATVEFFREVRLHLAANGVLVINFNLQNDGLEGVFGQLTATVGRVFPQVFQCELNGRLNTVIFAGESSLSIMSLRQGVSDLETYDPLHVTGRHLLNNVKRAAMGSRVFSDDLAPVELLAQKAVDGMIRNGLKELLITVLVQCRFYWSPTTPAGESGVRSPSPAAPMPPRPEGQENGG